MLSNDEYLIKRALRIDQNEKYPLFTFTLNGSELLEIADISRISRDNTGELIGYQRPEVKKHIQDIANYLNGEDVIFPNSIILALDPSVKFKASRGPQVGDGKTIPGSIEIPLPSSSKSMKPAWIVDGQQRVLALSLAQRKDFPIPINAFVTNDIEMQRDQFLRVNNTKPLPRGLITELLPEVSYLLPNKMAMRRIPAALCNWLNQDKSSPFFGLIRQASTPKSKRNQAVVTDTSIVKMVEENLTSPSGCLFPFRNLATGETDFENVQKLLITYWTAVKKTFPDAWSKAPTKSRLMHGVGIRSMGRLMNKVMSSYYPGADLTIEAIQKEISLIADRCHWTKGNWEELGGIAWNELQNVHRHISILSNYLIRIYIQSREK